MQTAIFSSKDMEESKMDGWDEGIGGKGSMRKVLGE